jgi:hypothetical protein
MIQSRLTVAGEMLKTSADSSMERPAKKRSSMFRRGVYNQARVEKMR